MSQIQNDNLDNYFLPDLCNTRAIIILLVVSEALVLAMTLIESSLLEFSWSRFTVLSFFVQWVCLLSASIICPMRPIFSRLPLWSVVLVALLQIALVTLLVSVAGLWLWYSLHLEVDWFWVLRNVIISLIFGAMLLRYFYVQNQWRLKSQAALQQRLAVLQANIRPHFFFNTLNTVASLIMTDPIKAESMLINLSRLFRAVLKNERSLISLADELELSKRYLDIEQTRLGEERFMVDWQLPSTLPSIEIPSLLLQPLLENAVYHGIQPSPQGGFIRIELVPKATSWHLIITNSICQQNSKPGNQMAQNNIRKRLEMLGKGAQLLISQEEKEYKATVILPSEVKI